MGSTPEELKAEIQRTRAELSSDVDSLTEKVSPSRIAQRRVDAVRGAAVGVKERVMGPASDAAGSASGTASSAAGAVSGAASAAAGAAQQAPEQARRNTQGSPVAAGLIAFGAGMLAAALIPTTEKEKELGGTVKERAGDVAQPVVEAAKDSAIEIKDNLTAAAQEAAGHVKDTAADAATATTEHAKGATSDVKETAVDATTAVREQTASSAEHVVPGESPSAATRMTSGASAAQPGRAAQVWDDVNH